MIVCGRQNRWGIFYKILCSEQCYKFTSPTVLSLMSLMGRSPPNEKKIGHYSMFHVTWTLLKFNRNRLGTDSAFVMISVPWSNQRARQVISEKLLSKEFHCGTTDQK